MFHVKIIEKWVETVEVKMSNKVRCEKCGEIIDHVLIEAIDFDGDIFEYECEMEVDEDGTVSIKIDDSFVSCIFPNRKITESVKCPKCNSYPFSKKRFFDYFVNIDVICGIEKENIVKE